MHTPKLLLPALFAATLALSQLFALATPSQALAQGTCSCNNGCHARPGQCVMNGGNGCAAGYAPFCETRATSCPTMGWVSCSGSCACVPIPGYDAGTPPDASMPPDAPVSESSVPPDGPVSDVARVDAPVSESSVPPDAPASDAPATPDVSVLPDGAVLLDAATPDAPACPDGVLLEGVCYREHCMWQGPELGWACLDPASTCRLLSGVPWCIPVCVGTTCGAGEVCDPLNGCVTNRCSTVSCEAGLSCFANRCVGPEAGAPGDASASGDGGVLGDGASGSLDGSRSMDGGSGSPRPNACGCHTPGSSRAGGHGAALAGLLLLLASISRTQRRKH